MVISTMSPGGLRAISAARAAKAMMPPRVQATALASVTGASSMRMSRVTTEAATNNTLSSEDMAAAMMATTRKSPMDVVIP